MGFTRCPCCALSPLPPLSTVDADLVSAGLLLVDTHNHLHQSAGGAVRRCDSYEAVLAVAEACWDSVLARCAEGPRSLPGLGVHPWQAHEVAEGWEARLRALLQQHPRALVGEIGLCKCARSLRGPGAKARVWPQQLRVFRTQLALAAELQRPTSVHCVKAHSSLVAALDDLDVLPPAVGLHSFSGSAHQIGQLLSTRAGPRLYFGFSHTVNVAMGGAAEPQPALLDAIRAVPERKLLVESDCADERSATLALPLALRLVADARGWTLERAARTTTENGLRFLRGDDGDDRDAGGAERPVCVACKPTAGSDESARPRLLVVSQCSR
mmetsp:Transcript_44318/g.145201  ORF Transcript_44318/g.145201 Transcript_44318/m.145201 type:complete len:326 (+) Transcript_44318:86-1063(+)